MRKLTDELMVLECLVMAMEHLDLYSRNEQGVIGVLKDYGNPLPPISLLFESAQYLACDLLIAKDGQSLNSLTVQQMRLEHGRIVRDVSQPGCAVTGAIDTVKGIVWFGSP